MKTSDTDRLAFVLKDLNPHRADEILYRVWGFTDGPRCPAFTRRISDLRARGWVIPRPRRDPEIRTLFIYQAVALPPENSARAKHPELPNGQAMVSTTAPDESQRITETRKDSSSGQTSSAISTRAAGIPLPSADPRPNPAVLDERERCARIAEDYDKFGEGQFSTTFYIGRKIAAKIREGSVI